MKEEGVKMRDISSDKIIKQLRDISTKIKLNERLSYEGISLWWLYRPYLFRLVKAHAGDEQPEKDSLKKVKIKFAKKYFISKALIRYIFGKLQNKNKRSGNDSHNKILVLSYTNLWRKYPTSQKEGGDKNVKRDVMLGDIIPALKNNEYNIIALDADPTLFVDFKVMIEKHYQENGLWRPIEYYLTPNIVRKALRASGAHKEEWNKLKKNKQCIDLLKGDSTEIPSYGLLKDYFEKLFSYGTFNSVLYIELVKNAIEIEEPDLILMTYGPVTLAKAASIAAKQKGIPTLEIQHGLIFPYTFIYIFTKYEASNDELVKSLHYSLPDKTAVYGSYYKELLTKMSVYSEDSVVVTGQPRCDILSHADRIYSIEKFLKKYKINPNHKIILWTTQCHGISNEENVKNFEAVFRTMQNLNDVTLVMKQHPNEGKRYTKMIKGYINKYGIDAVIPPKNSDTYEQLFACDLMITRHSTTAMEAVALNKPVIILNLSGEPDPVEYVKEGVAFGVYKEEDLKQAIEKLLNDESELAKNRAAYIEKYLYKIDGKATERIVNLIEAMIKSPRRETMKNRIMIKNRNRNIYVD